jgi:hypothetical protein
MIIEISGDRQAGRDTPDDDSALAAVEYSSSPVPPTTVVSARARSSADLIAEGVRSTDET